MRRIKVTPEGKIQAAKEYAEGKYGTSEQARKLGVDESTVREWVKRYQAQGVSAFYDTDTNKV